MPGIAQWKQVILPLATQADAADTSVGGAGAAAAITYAAAPGLAHVVDAIVWSYSAAPTGGSLTIADGATPILQADITAAGPGSLTFPVPLMGTAGNALTVTLAAPGGAVVGKLNVRHRVQTP